jgi:hypothetical protein
VRSAGRAFMAVLAVGTLVTGAVAVADAADPRGGGELRRALPAPGESSLKGTREYAALVRGTRRAVAVVVHRNGSAVAFVCDGKTFWRWLTGRVRRGRLTLRGANGARLTGTVSRARLRGVLRLAGNGRRIVLARSLRRAGLRRLTEGRFEGAWILTNAGVIRGVGTVGRTTVISSSADGTAPTEDEGTTATGGGEVEPRLLTKARCTIILLKSVPLRVAEQNGTLTPDQKIQLETLRDKFADLHCRDEFAGTTP